jgi:hypothetical protein
MKELIIGNYDLGKKPPNVKEFLRPLHGIDIGDTSLFKDEDRNSTQPFSMIEGSEVSNLQRFLFERGFMPRGKYEGVINGIFDYSTQASVRLFQEYCRRTEDKTIKPDGRIGPNTIELIVSWEHDKTKKADWVNGSSEIATNKEFNKWIEVLKEAKAFYLNELQNNEILIQIKNFPELTDTQKNIMDWNFDPNEIHLIGIRRNEDEKTDIRKNDDLFILLINGMVFKFWGSTDPNYDQVRKLKNKTDDAFLVEGQHKYRFGWHQGTYRALKPYNHGVLVFRDKVDDNSLTVEDLKYGLSTNKGINIHWSGVGSYNFSAGCQVIAGESYIDHQDIVQDCGKFAARNSKEFNDFKTKGAYNVLADHVVSFSKPTEQNKPNHIYYTLGRESSFVLKKNFGENYVLNTLQRMKSSIT